jgi:serine/threonine-protein kinase
MSTGGDPVPEAEVARHTAQIPTHIGELKHFRIDRKLASGGMGDVFLGFDTSLSRPVAIKTIRAQLAQDESFLKRFVREATAQANVVHPHVVQVYFVGEERGQWFLAMQIVDGGSLHDGLKRGEKMKWQDAARHMSNICEGLVVAEHLGIVHRDIKPSNILVDREGRAMLSDFGLAASVGATDALPSTKQQPATTSGSQIQLASVTQVGVVMGTPEYVAPEQLRVGPIDSRADVYALGATFFHLVTGTPAMPVTTLPEAIERYAKGARAPHVHSIAPDVPREFAAVLDKCLEVDPNRRYATMAALSEALAKALPQPEVKASPALRALVWLLDTAPFVGISYITYAKLPFLGPILFLLAGMIGMGALGSTPGIWLMRLRLRTTTDSDVSFLRGYARFLLQHGWYVPLTVGWSAIYGSSDIDVFFYVGAAWLALSVLGSLGAFSARGQALHDVVTGTRVLLDVRYR